MTVTKHFCNKCGQLITENRTLLIAKSGPIRQRLGELDFCLGCAEELSDWIGPSPTLAVDPALTRPFPSIAAKPRTPARATS